MKDPTETFIPDPAYAEIRNAINIKNTLDHVQMLPQLGYCPTKVQAFRKRFELDDRNDLDDRNSERSEAIKDNLEETFGDRDLANQVCEEIRDACSWRTPPHSFFHL